MTVPFLPCPGCSPREKWCGCVADVAGRDVCALADRIHAAQERRERRTRDRMRLERTVRRLEAKQAEGRPFPAEHLASARARLNELERSTRL